MHANIVTLGVYAVQGLVIGMMIRCFVPWLILGRRWERVRQASLNGQRFEAHLRRKRDAEPVVIEAIPYKWSEPYGWTKWCRARGITGEYAERRHSQGRMQSGIFWFVNATGGHHWVRLDQDGNAMRYKENNGVETFRGDQFVWFGARKLHPAVNQSPSLTAPSTTDTDVDWQ